MSECALCKIRGEKKRVVYDDGLVFVVINIEPIKPAHVMVLPCRCVPELSDLTPEEAVAFNRAVDRAMEAVASASGEGTLSVQNGRTYRTQPQHLHFHVLPSKKGLRQVFMASEGTEDRVRLEPDQLAALADSIRPHFTS